MVRHALLLTLTVVGTSCFTKPSAPASSDAVSRDAVTTVDAAADARPTACGAGQTPLPVGVSFPRRNALAVGDLNHDDIDDLAIFGETANQEQHIFVYFGNEAHPINVACVDDEIIVSDVRVIAAVRLGPHYPDDSNGQPNAGTSHLRFVALAPAGNGPHHIELREFTYATDQTRSSARIVTVPTNNIGIPNWTDANANNSAFILDRTYGSPIKRELLFGGNGKMFTASFNGNNQPNTLANEVIVTPTFTGSFYEVIEAYNVPSISEPLLLITGTEIHALSKSASTMFTMNTGQPGGEGGASGTVWASHDYSQVAGNYPVFGLRIPVYSGATAPPNPMFQVVLNDGRAFTNSLDATASQSTKPYLTDGVVVPNFGGNGTSFVGVLTANAGSNSPTNTLWFSAGYLPQVTDPMPQSQLEPLSDNELPLLAVGWFQSKKESGTEQVLVFYPKSPRRSLCFKPSIGIGIEPC